jgi:hypothetical protein
MGSRECEMGSRVRMVPERPMNSPNAIFGIQLSIVKVFFFFKIQFTTIIVSMAIINVTEITPI